MTPLGLTILIGLGVISFTLAFVIVLVPMNLFVRAYLVGFGWTGWFILPFVAPGTRLTSKAPTGSESPFGQWELG
jgi:hypothetical protein